VTNYRPTTNRLVKLDSSLLAVIIDSEKMGEWVAIVDREKFFSSGCHRRLWRVSGRWDHRLPKVHTRKRWENGQTTSERLDSFVGEYDLMPLDHLMNRG